MSPRHSPSRIARRQVLQLTAGAVGTQVLGAPFIHAADKSGTRLPVVGSGEYRYECHHDWGMDQLPAGANYGNASHGVAFDEAGLLYVTHHGNPGSMFVFDPQGRFVKAMGDFHQIPAGDGRQGRGHGVAIRKEGSEEFLYLAPNESSLDFVKMNLRGEIVWRKDRATLQTDSGRYPEKAAYRPTNISFLPDGGYVLGDGYGSNLLHLYDRQDKYVKTIGGTGEQNGEFRTPHGQWLDSRDGTPKIVVADRANARLQWFDLSGKHLQTLGGFLFPADVDVQGDILLVPDLHCRITLLDKNNQVLVHLGEDPAWRKEALDGFKMRGQRPKWRPGLFVHPHDATFDRDGNLFVAEWVSTGRLTKLRKVS